MSRIEPEREQVEDRVSWKIHNRIWQAVQKHASGPRPKRPEFVVLGSKLYHQFRKEAAKKMPHQWKSIAGLPVFENRSEMHDIGPEGIEVRGGWG